ncbi:uncharacterized protein LOC6565142 [Drosophila grimshawi]|uniref:uncharacterized protein LOC6565142 n=1 Tax=Drosophila grimshawi TaxID=7222 RepID=UPI000C871014|nr:uncharacterized protein LOC6565142 [Drosophila grimshawi]
MAHIAYMGITFIIILPILAANGNPTRSSVHKKVGDECQFLNFTESYCELGERCSTLETFVNDGIIALEEIPTCGFMDPTSSEMLCCPSQRSISSFPQAPKQSFNHLAFLLYLNPTTLDEYVIRCTAIVLSSTKVLTSSTCVDRENDEPSKVVVGFSNARNFNLFVHDKEIFDIKVRETTQLYNDIALLVLNRQINLDQMPNARSATLCIEEEAKGASNLYAVGFAQGVDGNNCDLFTTPLVLSDDCSLVQATRRVEGFDIPGMHLCVKPISGGSHSRQMDSCSKCLTASSSVLHVQRTDGSFCVAGIATPTTNKCVVNNNSIYYTSVVNSDARMFHGKYEKFTYRHRENDGSFGTP